jgi:hypothetical protein
MHGTQGFAIPAGRSIQSLGPMNPLLRWTLLFPAVAIGIAAFWLIYKLGMAIAFANCPAELQSTISISFHDFGLTESDQFCSARWFSVTNRVLLVSAIGLSAVAAGVIAFRLSPSHKRTFAVFSSILALSAAAIAFGAP